VFGDGVELYLATALYIIEVRMGARLPSFGAALAGLGGCADSVFQLVNACSALAAVAAVNSAHTGHFAIGGRDDLQRVQGGMR
jgi:hypothetical protein